MGPSLLRNMLGAAYAPRKAFVYALLYPLIAHHVVVAARPILWSYFDEMSEGVSHPGRIPLQNMV
ncbi:hypothetical protein V2W45_1349114 [Cenococcum geophilum]